MRMSLGWQASVIDDWGHDCVRQHACVIAQLIRNGLQLPADLAAQVPVLRKVATADAPSRYPYLDAGEEPPKKENDLEALKRMFDASDEEWKATQIRKHAAIDAYLDALKAHNAEGLADPVYLRGMAAVARDAPNAFEDIIGLLRRVDGPQLRHLSSLIACTAVGLSRTHPEGAAELFGRVEHVKPDVNLLIGPAQLPFHRLALWLASDSPLAKNMRFARLQSAPNDEALFTEVLCAAKVRKQAEVLDYVQKLAIREHPGDLARALTLAGFSDTNEIGPQIFTRLGTVRGFLGQVRDHARASYEQNKWARHWYQRACAAIDPVEFWCACALMIPASDGRFALWFNPVRDLSSAEMQPFARFVWNSLADRATEKLKDRRKSLFGLKPPSDDALRAIKACKPAI
jgi:hypothetical protein